ncbi:MAG: neutral zinc metallopeptidase [Ardenticatenaceae bacterium]
MVSLKRLLFVLLAVLLTMQWATTAEAAPTAQEPSCISSSATTGGGQYVFYVCDDAQARFRTAYEGWGLQKVGYPISQRYSYNGFVMQAFQKAIMQWRPETQSVALVNIFDELHQAGVDKLLLQHRQVPLQLPDGWDGDLPFEEVVKKRVALLTVRPALLDTYLASSDPLTFYGLPTSEVTDMGNHYAVRLQRAVLQEWKQDVPWARAGQVTIANGGDIAKELGGIPDVALQPEQISLQDLMDFVQRDLDSYWSGVFAENGLSYYSPTRVMGYTGSVETACGIGEAGNAFYCLLDRSIYYDIILLEKELKTIGDFAPAMILAHEYGHFIQHQLEVEHQYTLTQELQADCLAGSYARHARDTGVLEPGDLEEGAESLYDKGDNAPWFDPRAHGTPEQRVQSFAAGFAGGAGACFQ